MITNRDFTYRVDEAEKERFFAYRLSKEALDAFEVVSGKRPDKWVKVEIPMQAISPEQRALVLEYEKLQFSPDLRYPQPRFTDQGHPVYAGDTAQWGTAGHLSTPYLITGENDGYLLETTLWENLQLLVAGYPDAVENVRVAKLFAEKKRQAEQAAIDDNRRRREEENARMHAECRAQQAEKWQEEMNILWDANGEAVHNLFRAARAAAKLNDCDWIRQVTQLNPDGVGAYAFEGEHLTNKTQQVRREEMIFLIRHHPSKKREENVFVRFDGNGWSEIWRGESEDKGWALLALPVLKPYFMPKEKALSSPAPEVVQINWEQIRHDLHDFLSKHAMSEAQTQEVLPEIMAILRDNFPPTLLFQSPEEELSDEE